MAALALVAANRQPHNDYWNSEGPDSAVDVIANGHDGRRNDGYPGQGVAGIKYLDDGEHNFTLLKAWRENLDLAGDFASRSEPKPQYAKAQYAKPQYAKARHRGDLMIWELSEDRNHELLNVIFESLR